MDAVIVPTSRPVNYLDDAVMLGRHLCRPLVVLCSDRVHAGEVLARWPGEDNLTVIDLTPPALPPLETSNLLAAIQFDRHADSSLKRNVGLAIARMAGWTRVLFLDDDMAVRHPDDLELAGALLDHVVAVGLSNNGFPDNSVVCHAWRAVGGDQGSFIGGGALAVAVDRVSSFFPDIYNEDWFFLLDEDRLHPVAVAGTVTQRDFDPFEDPARAGSEELGDCLAEGLFALLDHGYRIHDADASYWDHFLADRYRLITRVLDRIPARSDLDAGQRGRMVRALRASLSRLQLISAELCVGYLKLWHRDRESWAAFLDGLPGAELPDAIRKLGLAPAAA